MTIIPARVAGVREIIACTPPNAGVPVLAALALSGATRVFRVGGAQGIAAMAFGTRSVPKCDKLFGPGNAFVNAAKTLAASEGVAIDCPAGPSEILIIADETANPRLVAADLLAQAEHDENACAILVTTSEKLAGEVAAEIESQLYSLPRNKIAGEALKRNGALLIAENLEAAVAFANAYAPEHLELLVENPDELLQKIVNAGAVFLGRWSCEAAGDYAAGPNHVLPTGGLARTFSSLSVESFMKQTTVTKLDKEELRGLVKTIAVIARAEGLEAHARSAEERFK
jgi:histidinol dehydrogenase